MFALLTRLERKLGWLSIENLTLYLVGGQALVLVFGMANPDALGKVVLVPARVLEGEWWRLITFVFFPPVRHPIFAAFALYFFYLMGTALEAHWGKFRYNIFLLIAYLATVGSSVLFPAHPVSNAYIGGSVFLAFAQLYPEFVIYIFFVLPMRIKWVAWLTWAGYIFMFITASSVTRVTIIASVANFLLFFARDILQGAKYGKKRMEWQIKAKIRKDEPIHTCAVCGATDRSHPDMDFRYCSSCEGHYAYCTEHLSRHEHKRDSTGTSR